VSGWIGAVSMGFFNSKKQCYSWHFMMLLYLWRLNNMRNVKYVVYQEGKYFVSQCLNVDVSSFGESFDEAVFNLKDAVELYFKEEQNYHDYIDVGDALIGETTIHA
jgi:predicted RNase H-like HicB family nuclease